MLAFQVRKQSWTGETILAPCSGLFPQLKRQHFNGLILLNHLLSLALFPQFKQLKLKRWRFN